MKTQNLFFMLILISMAFSFISCTDEDDKVEIPQLVGKWIEERTSPAGRFCDLLYV